MILPRSPDVWTESDVSRNVCWEQARIEAANPYSTHQVPQRHIGVFHDASGRMHTGWVTSVLGPDRCTP